MSKFVLLLFLLGIVFTSSAQTNQADLTQITEDKGYYRKVYSQSEGKLDGEYKEIYTETGAVRLEGSYKNGLKEGLWIYRDRSNKLKKEENYHQDKLDGTCTTYQEGEARITESYKNGTKDGLFETYNRKGRLVEKKVFLNGKLQSSHTYYDDGSVKSESVIPKDSQKPYTTKQYYPSGKLKVEATMKDNTCLKSTSYFENGQIQFVYELIDGQLKLIKRFNEKGKSLSTSCDC